MINIVCQEEIESEKTKIKLIDVRRIFSVSNVTWENNKISLFCVISSTFQHSVSFLPLPFL